MDLVFIFFKEAQSLSPALLKRSIRCADASIDSLLARIGLHIELAYVLA